MRLKLGIHDIRSRLRYRKWASLHGSGVDIRLLDTVDNLGEPLGQFRTLQILVERLVLEL